MEEEYIDPAIPTEEEIAKRYSALLDSVAVINEIKALEEIDEEQSEILERNKEHLQIMLTKDFWTNEDMTPVNEVLAE